MRNRTGAAIAAAFAIVLAIEPALADDDIAFRRDNPSKIFGKDERVPVDDPRSGRQIPTVCTAWLISNGALLTAGHCFLGINETAPQSACPKNRSKFDGETVQFNVPLSSPTGVRNTPPPRYIYPLRPASIVCENINDSDWAIFATGLSFAGLLAGQEQGYYRVALPSQVAEPTEDTAASIRISGFGADGPPPNYGLSGGARNIYSNTNQTAVGPLLSITDDDGVSTVRYTTDTMPGNSGSAIVLNGSQIAIGIHNAGSMEADPPSNWGTGFTTTALATAMHAFPGGQYQPVIPGTNVVYVDAGSLDAPVAPATPTGNLFYPYQTLTDGFARVTAQAANHPMLLSVVTGSYPEIRDPNNAKILNITVSVKSVTYLQMPVGDVDLWKPADIPH